jgi:hypothetical protein
MQTLREHADRRARAYGLLTGVLFAFGVAQLTRSSFEADLSAPRGASLVQPGWPRVEPGGAPATRNPHCGTNNFSRAFSSDVLVSVEGRDPDNFAVSGFCLTF